MTASSKKSNIVRKDGFDNRKAEEEIKDFTCHTQNENGDLLLRPKLDKWGLPMAILDEIFPLLPPDTELISTNSSKDLFLG
jgi:hypothetical protein